MIIKEEQIRELGAGSKQDFVERTLLFLCENTPEWAEQRSDDEARSYITSVIELAGDRSITKEINIQKILYYCIRYGIQIPFRKRMEEVLGFESPGEDERIKNMIKEIHSGHVR